jgi:hypothetical protein
MRKILLSLAALAALGLALPAVSSTADAREVIVIKKKHRHYDHGRHYGWYRGHHYGWERGHHYGWRNHQHHGDRVVIRAN